MKVSGGDVECDSREGRSCGSTAKAEQVAAKLKEGETDRCRSAARCRDRSDAVLLHVFEGGLAVSAGEQTVGTAAGRSATKKASYGRVSGREVGGDIGCGKVAQHSGTKWRTRRYPDMNRLSEASEAA
jgi:hypothetical protein